MKNKNIDLIRRKSPTSASLTQDTPSNLAFEQNTYKTNAVNHKKTEPAPQRAKLVKVFDHLAIQFSIVRSLFSIRVILFIILPVFVYQLRYISVLNPNQLVNTFRDFVLPKSSLSLVSAFGFLIIFLLLALVINMVVFTFLVRYKFLLRSRTKKEIINRFKESLSIILPSLTQKAVSVLLLLCIGLMLWFGYYVSFLLGYGSTSTQILLVSAVTVLGAITLIYHRFYRYSSQLISSLGGTTFVSRNSFIFSNIINSPIRVFSKSIQNILYLAAFTVASILLAFFQIYILGINQSISFSIFSLALYSTLVVLLWSVWNSIDTSFWCKVARKQLDVDPKKYSDELDVDYSGLIIVFISVVLILIVYWVASFFLLNQIEFIMENVSNFMPGKIDLRLPKPN